MSYVHVNTLGIIKGVVRIVTYDEENKITRRYLYPTVSVLKKLKACDRSIL